MKLATEPGKSENAGLVATRAVKPGKSSENLEVMEFPKSDWNLFICTYFKVEF